METAWTCSYVEFWSGVVGSLSRTWRRDGVADVQASMETHAENGRWNPSWEGRPAFPYAPNLVGEAGFRRYVLVSDVRRLGLTSTATYPEVMCPGNAGETPENAVFLGLNERDMQKCTAHSAERYRHDWMPSLTVSARATLNQATGWPQRHEEQP